MATDSRHRFAYHNRLFLLLLLFVWLLAGSFIAFLYGYERHIILASAPHDSLLDEILASDRTFTWITLALTSTISIAAWIITRRLGSRITSLNDYAEQATADRDRQRAAALREEQEKIRIKRQLTNNINHELKTPVAAIQGYLETLVANPDMNSAQRQTFLKKSLEHSDRLRRLLIDISTITRMEEGSEQIRKEPVVINDLLDDLRSDMSLRPAEQRMRLNIDFPHEVTIMGSPSLLSSILRNLTDNAIAYSCGRDIYITLEENNEHQCAISFADNGVGIEEEHLPRLFERFYRADKGRSRKAGGTGLGLSIVRNAVAIHGGEITARNRAEGGLEFRFTLRKV